jgi:hypothetical protein
MVERANQGANQRAFAVVAWILAVGALICGRSAHFQPERLVHVLRPRLGATNDDLFSCRACSRRFHDERCGSRLSAVWALIDFFVS